MNQTRKSEAGKSFYPLLLQHRSLRPFFFKMKSLSPASVLNCRGIQDNFLMDKQP